MNIDNVIKGLECKKTDPEIGACYTCPYFNSAKTPACDSRRLANDALLLVKLLKKQEAVEPIRSYARCSMKPYGTDIWYSCGSCKAGILKDDKFCHECGRRVNWNE